MHGELRGRADIIQPPQTLHALRIRNDLRRTVSPSILEDIDMTIVTEDAILDPPETYVLMHDGLILLSPEMPVCKRICYLFKWNTMG